MATAPVFETQARNGDKIRNASAIINCTDVLATLLWYQDKLGLQVEFAWGDPVCTARSSPATRRSTSHDRIRPRPARAT